MNVLKKGILFGLVLISAWALGQNKTSDFGLVGKVKSVQSVTKMYNDSRKTTTSGFLDSEQFDSVFLKFDLKRNLILKENFLDYRGRLAIFDRTKYRYNPQNQIEELVTTLIQNGEEPQKTSQRKVYYYLKNQMIRMDEFNYGRTSNQYWVVNSVYNSGKLKEKVFWMEDEIFSRSEFEFDWNNNPLSEKTYHNNGNLGKTLLYENNSSGLPVKISTHSGNSTSKESFIYGPSYLLEYILTDAKGIVLESDNYDEEGMISVAKRWNHSRGIHDIYSFNFDRDSNNNWIRCEISKNNVPMYQIIRKINYYN